MPKLFKPRVIASESQEQQALFKWKAYNIRAVPELFLLHHIPNGGLRDKITARHMKEQGVMAGIPDISLPVARGGYHGMYIEMKVGNNKPSERQQECIKWLREQGYRVEICYGWVEAAEAIKEYLSDKTA